MYPLLFRLAAYSFPSCITDALLNPLNSKYVKLPHYSTKIHEAANHSLMEGNEDKTALKIPLGNRIVLIC